MCWLFVVKVLLMWDYIRLHHYYISKYSIHQRWVYCWLNNEQYVDSLLWKFWSISNYIMLTWDIRLSLCVHVLEKESLETRVLFRLNIIRYSSHIPECTVLTSTRMKNHTWVYCSHKYTYEEPYLSVLFSQVHVWRTIPECTVLTSTRMKNHTANIGNVSAPLLHQSPGEWDYYCKVLEICHSLIPRSLHPLQH